MTRVKSGLNFIVTSTEAWLPGEARDIFEFTRLNITAAWIALGLVMIVSVTAAVIVLGRRKEGVR